MTNSGRIVFTRDEITALADFAHFQPKSRTYDVQRDSKNVLYVKDASNKLHRLTPERAA